MVDVDHGGAKAIEETAAPSKLTLWITFTEREPVPPWTFRVLVRERITPVLIPGAWAAATSLLMRMPPQCSLR